MLAALQGHGFYWPTGKDQLLIISVGTGRTGSPARRQGSWRQSGGPAGHCRPAIADGRLRTDEPRHPPVADALPDALDHRPGRRRHEARQPERPAARDLRPLQRAAGAGLAEDRARRRSRRRTSSSRSARWTTRRTCRDLADLGAAGRGEAGQARTSAGELSTSPKRRSEPQAERPHARDEPTAATQSRAVQRPYDRRARPRETPRFPPDKEPIAAQAIAERFGRPPRRAGRSLHLRRSVRRRSSVRRSRARAIRSPRDLYPFRRAGLSSRNRSTSPTSDWRARFFAAKARSALHVAPLELGPLRRARTLTSATIAGCWTRPCASARTRSIFVCLWNGEGGDGPGGAQHMMEEVRKKGGRAVWLDTTKLWG